MKKKIGYCQECDAEFEVRHETKSAVCFCPFCAEEISSKKRKLYTSFEELDDFESEDDDDSEVEIDEDTEDEE